jgi:hypothetical protein
LRASHRANADVSPRERRSFTGAARSITVRADRYVPAYAAQPSRARRAQALPGRQREASRGGPTTGRYIRSSH